MVEIESNKKEQSNLTCPFCDEHEQPTCTVQLALLTRYFGFVYCSLQEVQMRSKREKVTSISTIIIHTKILMTRLENKISLFSPK